MAKETFAKSKFGIDNKVIGWVVCWLDGDYMDEPNYKEYKRGDAAYRFANDLAYRNNTVCLMALIADETGVYWKTVAVY